MLKKSSNPILEMFNNLPHNRLLGDDYFNQFPYISALPENISSAYQKYLLLLNFLCAKSRKNYQFFHKGTPFYWLGLCSYLLDNFQTSMFFINASVAEDIKSKKKFPPDETPGFLFLMANPSSPNQAGRNLVKDVESRIQRAIDFYNLKIIPGHSLNGLSLNDIRKYFLLKNLNRRSKGFLVLSTTLLSFLLEWDYLNMLLDLVPSIYSIEPFYFHLLKGCNLLESLLKNNPKITPQGNTLHPIINNIYPSLYIQSINSSLDENLQNIFKDVTKTPISLQNSFMFSLRVRNSVSHNLVWSLRLKKNQFQLLHFLISSSCLHVINCLYR